MLNILINMSRYIFVIIILTFTSITLYIKAKKNEEPDINTKGYIYQQILIIIYALLSIIILFNTQFKVDDKNAVIYIMTLYISMLIIVFIMLNTVFKKSNILLWNLILFLTSISVIMLTRLNIILAKKQVIWIIISILVSLFLIMLSKIKIKFDKLSLLYQVGCIILLFLPFICGKRIYGSLNWVTIKGVTFQPSEFVKILLVFYLASVYKDGFKFKNFLVSSLTVFLLIIMLVIQKDLGTALIYFITYLIMIYYYTKKEIFLLGGLFSAVGASFISYHIFGHVRARIESWLNPWENIDGKGYQITQSLFSIAAGKWFGTGLTKGMPQYIPIVTKDFIFSGICEEFGSIFSIVLIIIYLIVFDIIITIAGKNHSSFSSLIVIGLSSILVFQTFLILGGVIKLIPLTGLTLPYISYGGSSMLLNFIIVSIIQIIYSNCNNTKNNTIDYRV